jgi:hypothetical protein
MISLTSWRSIVTAALVISAIPVVAQAQERELGTFRGRVDKDVRISLRAGDVSSSTMSGTDLRSRYRMISVLPQQEGTVRVALENGRGDVSVIQQPTASNGYTAIVRVFDRSSGADVYRFSTYWTPSLTTGTVRPGGILGRGRRANLPALHWSGDVDGAVELRWRQGNVSQRILGGNALRNVASTVTGDIAPGQQGRQNQPDQVNVSVREGRGQVQVIQQPSAQNRYTTIVRITDPARGYGHYDFDAIWR